MKILLVHNKYQQPGGEDVVFEQERKLLEGAGHKVAVYCRSNDEINGYSGLQRLTLIRNTVSSEASRREVLAVLRREEPEVVHIHNTFMVISPSIYSACREAGVPVVQTLHNYRLLCPAANFFRDGHVCEECTERGVWQGVKYGCYRGSRGATATVALMLTVHRQRHTYSDLVDRFIALSDFARSKFIAGGLPGERIEVKPNFVDPDPGERKASGGYAVFVGRLSDEKGLETLVAAWGRLGNRVPLVIVGDGPVGPALKTQAEKSGVNISFRGRLPRSEAQHVVKGSSFMVLPSECYENFPMGMVEAFACGVPVICSRLGALQELVDDGRTGLHFIPGSPEHLAERVQWAWAHAERMREMGKEARKDFEKRYTAEKNYSMLMDIYRTTIGQPHEVTA